MISFDTNILYAAYDKGNSLHKPAHTFLTELIDSDQVVMCEMVLAELYILLRNPVLLKAPLSSQKAADVCQVFRQNPRWRLVENAPVMKAVWGLAAKPNFPRRRIFDSRLGLTLKHHGVKNFATVNVKDFKEVGFEKVWNPLKGG